MTRKLIALAVMGALAPAVALADGSSVVLTGVIHGSIDFFRAKGPSTTPGGGDTEYYKRQASIGNNATRWQIDGTEDLGWSKAIFSLAFDQPFSGCSEISDGSTCPSGRRFGFNGNGNGGQLANRNSYLGLTGGWGTFRIGQNEHEYEIQNILQDPDPASEAPFNNLTIMTRYGLGNGMLAGGGNGLTRRSAQSIWYTSPDFAGVTINLAYITPGGRNNTANVGPNGGRLSASGYELAAQWKAPFGLSLYGAYAQYNDDAGFDGKNNGIRGGVGFGTELFQIDVGAEQLKIKSNEASLASGGAGTGLNTGIVVGTTSFNDLSEVKRTNFFISGALNFGQHHIRAQFSAGQKAKTNAGEISDSQGRNIFLAYGFTVSKRTEFQVVAGKTDNKPNASYNTGAAFGTAGVDLDGISFGIRHSF